VNSSIRIGHRRLTMASIRRQKTRLDDVSERDRGSEPLSKTDKFPGIWSGLCPLKTMRGGNLGTKSKEESPQRFLRGNKKR